MARPKSGIAERIVRAARERFLLEGVEGASLRAIARDAGTNLGMVYYYYPSKDDLFLAVVESVYAKLLDEISRELPASDIDTRKKLERVYLRIGKMSDEEMQVVRLIMREVIAGQHARMKLLFERFSRGHLGLLGAALGEGIGRGEVRADVPPFALMVCTLFLGLFPQVMRRRLDEAGVPISALIPPPTTFARILSTVLFEGIGARPVERAPAPNPQTRPAPVAEAGESTTKAKKRAVKKGTTKPKRERNA